MPRSFSLRRLTRRTDTSSSRENYFWVSHIFLHCLCKESSVASCFFESSGSCPYPLPPLPRPRSFVRADGRLCSDLPSAVHLAVHSVCSQNGCCAVDCSAFARTARSNSNRQLRRRISVHLRCNSRSFSPTLRARAIVHTDSAAQANALRALLAATGKFWQ